MNLSVDQKALISKNHLNPRKVDTATFLEGISEVLLGGDKTIVDIEKELAEYVDHSDSIGGILNGYEHIISQFPTEFCSDYEKEQRIKFCVIKYLPEYLIPILREKEAEKINGMMSLYSFKKFINTHKTTINNHLQIKRYGKK